MSKVYDEKLEAYAKLKAEHPAEPLRFFADHFGVNQGTVSRWNKALKKLSLKEEAIDELETRLRKEYDAKLQTLLDEKAEEQAEREHKRLLAEERVSENKRQYFQRIFNECQKVDIYPSETIDVTWQGIRVTLFGGQKNTVPEVIAGVYLDSQKQGQQAANTIARYQAGQHLGKLGRIR